MRERISKLLLPLMTGMFTVVALMAYYADKFHNGYQGTTFLIIPYFLQGLSTSPAMTEDGLPGICGFCSIFLSGAFAVFKSNIEFQWKKYWFVNTHFRPEKSSVDIYIVPARKNALGRHFMHGSDKYPFFALTLPARKAVVLHLPEHPPTLRRSSASGCRSLAWLFDTIPGYRGSRRKAAVRPPSLLSHRCRSDR